ncbi:MAG TPA: hypothetical protein VGT98_04405 [Candidatus Elarobacter sp.]|nr:hypothetical protein [Candidatus Elarobacter sp.]HEV2738312.1 hypothetical protein [Candidatus Elarobacter sp.]
MLYGALAACDFAMAVQQLNEERWKQADDQAKKEGGKPVSSYELERRPKIVKGIWTPPFRKLEEVFKRVEDTDELREFAMARDQRAE